MRSVIWISLLLWTLCQNGVFAQFRFVEYMKSETYCETRALEELKTVTSTDGVLPIKYWINNANSIPLDMCSGSGTPKKSPDGRVCLQTELNREDAKSFNVIFYAEDSDTPKNTASATGKVTVNDANDNPPLFVGLPYIQNVLESSKTSSTKGAVVETISASDADDGPSGTVLFELSGAEASIFIIGNRSESGGKYSVNITMNEDLDFETSQSHSVNVIAKDDGIKGDECGATIQLNSTTNFYLTVLDGPDSPPVFSKDVYTATVVENSRTFKTEPGVSARDGDRSLSWTIEYSLEEDLSIFSIHKDTGVISIVKDIDRESPDTVNGIFILRVIATEIEPADADYPGFPGAESANKTVTITVEDEDDNSPLFYNSSDSPDPVTSFAITISEDTLNTIPDFSFNVRDIDLDDNAHFMLEVAGEDAKFFEVSPGEGKSEADVTLKVIKELDYETKPSLIFQVIATGVSDTTKTSTATIDVTLTDENDNSPVFETSNVEAFVPEHSDTGKNITIIKATDSDDGEYGEVSYNLLGSDAFDIYPDGTVYVVDPNLDREVRSEYYLTVRASDCCGLINTTLLTIFLEDINDEIPRFQQSQYLVNWNENDDAVTPVSVNALDLDEWGTNNSWLSLKFADTIMDSNYSIVATSGENGEISGDIKPTIALDAEDIDGECKSGVIEYSFGIVVVDHGDPQNNGTANVLVYLRDENDHTPYFEQDSYEGEVAEFSSLYTEIAVISAKDDDKCSPNNDITYTVDSDFPEFLVAENDDGDWSLQVKSEQLDRDAQAMYNVIVNAVDNGQPRRTGNATVTVTITDINNKPPEFDLGQSNSSISVNENDGTGTVVGTVVATDKDEDFDLTYSIARTTCHDENENLVDSTKCDRWFDIKTVSQKGQISVAEELDRETVERVTLTILVEDMNATGTEKQTDEMIVEVEIEDYNDNLPEFVEPIPVFKVIEEVDPETPIGQLSATDKDITTTITFSTNNTYVKITEQGELRVRSNINREGLPGDNFEAVIYATDDGTPSLTSSITVNFTVDDTNDNSPSFANSSYECEVLEGEDPGAYVCVLTATDEDIGDNAKITYSVNPGDTFAVDPDTGNISTIRQIDRETLSNFQFKLKAKDNAGQQSRETEVDVTVNILDIDDNDPNYKDFTPQSMEISEGSEEGDLVGTIKEAFDKDTEEFSNNYYFLVYEGESDSRDVFSLDKESRKLALAQTLDREKISSYSFYVYTTKEDSIESDVYTAEMEDFVLQVNIAVLDINDNSPEFTQQTYTTDMQFDTSPSDTDVIVTVLANDPDEGNNAFLTYSITRQRFVNAAEEQSTANKFKIEKIDDEGYILLQSPTGLTQEESDGGQYVLDILAQDGGGRNGTATVFVKVFTVTEVVELESLHDVDYLNEHRDQLEKDLEEALDADVVIDAISVHGEAVVQEQARAESDSSQPQSDIFFHATVWNESTLVPADEIATKLDSKENNDVRATWAIVGIEDGQPTEAPISEAASLKTVLVVACVLLVVILIVYTIAFVCMRRKYKLEIKASKATEDAARQTLHSYNAEAGGGLNIPGTNANAAGESKLYLENQMGNIDMEEWRRYNETDDDNNSIDDNAVDSQDSAISEGHMDPADDDNLDDLDIDHDWGDDGGAENLAAALNSSKKRGGEENIILMFDNPAMDHTAM